MVIIHNLFKYFFLTISAFPLLFKSLNWPVIWYPCYMTAIIETNYALTLWFDVIQSAIDSDIDVSWPYNAFSLRYVSLISAYRRSWFCQKKSYFHMKLALINADMLTSKNVTFSGTENPHAYRKPTRINWMHPKRNKNSKTQTLKSRI